MWKEIKGVIDARFFVAHLSTVYIIYVTFLGTKNENAVTQ
jgi:hypothetical protein